MSFVRMHLSYASYVLRHKWFVFLECIRLGIWWRGMVHDWSKLLPSEWSPYANHFRGGIQTGRNKTGYYKPTDTGDPAFDFAWFLHQKRNDHHWQWWLIPEDGSQQTSLPMSDGARKEMLADWRGAGRAQGTPDVLAWYAQNWKKMLLHPDTRLWIESQLRLLR